MKECCGRVRTCDMHYEEEDDEDDGPVCPSTLKKKFGARFGSLAQSQKDTNKCMICMFEFEDEDNVSELQCDRRHIFHTECLQNWLKVDKRCPLCKSTIKRVDVVQ